MTSPIQKVSNGGDKMVTMVDIRHAISVLGIVVTVSVAIISYQAGASSTVSTLEGRIDAMETVDHLQTSRIDRIDASVTKHIDWSELRSRDLQRIELKQRLLEQRINYHHPGTNHMNVPRDDD